MTDGSYRLTTPTQLINAGLEPPHSARPAWVADLGVVELFSVPLPQGAGVEIGAAEYAVPGDFNFDGVVDAADYVALRKNPGAFSDMSEGYYIWGAHFGQSAGSGSSANLPVPEPSACWLLMFWLAASSDAWIRQAQAVGRQRQAADAVRKLPSIDVTLRSFAATLG
jgi:hypothetical protein